MKNPVRNVKCDLPVAHSSSAGDWSGLNSSTVSFLENLKPGPIAVAVSGGSDSLGALHQLHEFNNAGRELICLTVDHGLRAEAIDEARYVGDICQMLGVEHRILTWQGDKPANGIQNAARQARYRLLADECEKIGAIGVVTGHTYDDQRETIAMRRMRSGDDCGHGLSGMAPMTLFFNRMWVLRPFLDVPKCAFQTYLKTRDIRWIEDVSNVNRDFERVRIRQSTTIDVSREDIHRYQTSRKDIAERAALFVEDHCQLIDGLYASVQINSAKVDDIVHALASLIDVIGGRRRMLGSSRREQLRTLIMDRTTAQATLGRCLVQREEDQIFIEREKRGDEQMVILPQQTANWDGRFNIWNKHSDKCLHIEHDEMARGRPPQFRWQAADEVFNLSAALTNPDIEVLRKLNRFDNVLSSFDLPLANTLAKKFGRSPYFAPSNRV